MRIGVPFLLLAFSQLALCGEQTDARIRVAVNKTLPLLQKSAATYTNERSCFSCHHQALTAMTISLARQRGFKTDQRLADAQSDFTLKYFRGRSDLLKQRKGVPGGAYTAGYALVSLAANDRECDETSALLVDYLLKKQSKQGAWHIDTKRPPLESSHFTATAISLRGLQQLAEDKKLETVRERAALVREWLERESPTSTEDKAFRLFGLSWSGANVKTIKQAVNELLAEQREDGGWGQLDDMTSDSYATGQTLVALHQAGQLPTTTPAYRKGLDFLLESQRGDGSWHVKTRSKPIQEYFESDFPHGKSQFISISGTCWATMALILATDESTETKHNVDLFKWERGIGVRSQSDSSIAMYLWFYEWNMFDAMLPGQHTGGKFPLPREVNENKNRAMISSPELMLLMTAESDSVDLLLTVTNRSKHEWPEIAGIIPCFNPGPPKSDERTKSFVNDDTYFVGPDGLVKLKKREIHFNEKLRKLVDAESKNDEFVFSHKWPTSDVNATAGLLIRQSTDGKWVTGIAWERYLSSQGHNPWDCMHQSVQVGPLKPQQSRKIRGKIYLMPGTKEDLLKRFEQDFPREKTSP